MEASSRCHIGFENDNFVIEARDNDRRTAIHVDDLLALILESEMASITAAALAACGERGIPVVCCRRHLPVSLSLPIGAGWNGAQMRRLQARALRGDAAARRLWRRTVRAKIIAQSKHMEMLGTEGARRVRRLADNVLLDGQETVEAQAAFIYWRAIFPDFERSDERDTRNGLLNWGYAVLLAAVGRALCALGFDPALGFGHASRTNAWALACDLMEPFRPTVDLAIATFARRGDQVEAAAVKSAILRPFANDGPAKREILEVVRGYREFLEDGNETHVRYPNGPLAT